METSLCLSELSKCVRCGSCKAFCPTYDHDVTEPMSARGRLALVRGLLTGSLTPSDLLNERLYSCILCGACEQLCPPRVDITGALYHGRRLVRDSDGKRRNLRLLTRHALRKPMLAYKIAKMLEHIAFPYLVKKGRLPFPITLPPHPLRDDQQVYKPEKKIGRVAVFTGCSVNFLFPHLGISLINVLLHLGYEVVLPKGEVCCGAPLRGLGLEEEAIELAKRNQAAFGKLRAEAVVSLCPTCVVSLRLGYPKLIGAGIESAMDLSTFLLRKTEVPSFRPISSLSSVTYHDPCHLRYSLGVKEEPRRLLREAGAELIDAEGKGCCGFGGVFGVQYREISDHLLKQRSDAYARTGADAVVTSCPGCMLQLMKGLEGRPVMHLVEIMEEAIC